MRAYFVNGEYRNKDKLTVMETYLNEQGKPRYRITEVSNYADAEEARRAYLASIPKNKQDYYSSRIVKGTPSI